MTDKPDFMAQIPDEELCNLLQTVAERVDDGSSVLSDRERRAATILIHAIEANYRAALARRNLPDLVIPLDGKGSSGFLSGMELGYLLAQLQARGVHLYLAECEHGHRALVVGPRWRLTTGDEELLEAHAYMLARFYDTLPSPPAEAVPTPAADAILFQVFGDEGAAC